MREDVREDVKMSRCERRCEDEKMFYRPPLLEEPCAQTLSGKRKKTLSRVNCDNFLVYDGKNWCWIHGEGRRGPRILFYFRIPEN